MFFLYTATPILSQSLEMTKVDRNMSELRKIVCKYIILTLVGFSV
jgi:hypothetical protein